MIGSIDVRDIAAKSVGGSCRVGELGGRFVQMNQAAPYRSGGEGLDARGADEARPDTATPLQPALTATVDRLTELIRLAQGHEEAGRLNEAEAALCRALALAPEHAAALHWLGVVGFRQGRIEEAAALMERSLAASPGTALYHRNICEVYRSLGRYDDALAAGHRAVGLTPRDPHCYHNLGVLHYHRLELDEAIHCAQS